jgi:hypothetical protein
MAALPFVANPERNGAAPKANDRGSPLRGLSFGGERAAGAVLMGEVTRAKYRVGRVGFVQTGDRPRRGRTRPVADRRRWLCCGDARRATGPLFPMIIGYAMQVMPLGTAIALLGRSPLGGDRDAAVAAGNAERSVSGLPPVPGGSQ